MAFLGLLFIAIGIGLLLGISLLPMLLIMLGGVMLFSRTPGRPGKQVWNWWFYTVIPQRREHHQRYHGQEHRPPGADA